MRSPRPKSMGWIILVAYLAGTVITSRSVVLCLEIDGSTAIEIAGDHEDCLGGGGPASESSQAKHMACRASCCDQCPCEDSPLAIEPARVVKKDPMPGGNFAINPGISPWSGGYPGLHVWPAALRPNERAAAGDVTSRTLRSVVLRL